jgi:endonuclease YncB( thermonuclease family)
MAGRCGPLPIRPDRSAKGRWPRTLALAAIGGLAGACAHGWAVPPRSGEVFGGAARAIDGDTLEVMVRGHPVRVRLLGEDAPERGEPGFHQAKAATAARVGPWARCVVGPGVRDAFGRVLAICGPAAVSDKSRS